MTNKIKIILLILVIPFLIFIFSYSNTNNTDNSSITDNSTLEIYDTVFINVIFQGQETVTYTSISKQDLSLEEIMDTLMEKGSFKYTKESSSMGSYIKSVNGVIADPNSEFFNIKINGEDALIGISDIDPLDKDVIDITLIKF